MKITARYYDGHVSKPREITLWASNSILSLDVEGSAVSFGRDRYTVAEPLGRNAPRIINLQTGGRLELAQQPGLGDFLGELAHKDSQWVLLQTRWKHALPALGLFGFLIGVFYVWGLPTLSDTIAEQIPFEVAEKIDDKTLGSMDKDMLTVSDLSSERQDQITELFERMVQHMRLIPGLEIEPEVRFKLYFRRIEAIPNAFALPGGSLVLLDGLVNKMTDQEILAVLCHEVGHVVHRHALNKLVRASIVGLAFAFVAGDVSSIGTTILVGLSDLAMSRGMEDEADAYAAESFYRMGLGVTPLVTLYEKLGAANELAEDAPSERSTSNEPELEPPASEPGQSEVLGYLSTHPSSKNRIVRIQNLWKILEESSEVVPTPLEVLK